MRAGSTGHVPANTNHQDDQNDDLEDHDDHNDDYDSDHDIDDVKDEGGFGCATPTGYFPCPNMRIGFFCLCSVYEFSSSPLLTVSRQPNPVRL